MIPSAHPAVRLIVNADDYGRTRGVSRGIRKAHRDGIVTSTTVMINQPGVEDDLQAALQLPHLGVGLHLTFTAGRPVLGPEEVSAWVDASGRFLDQHTVWARAERLPTDQLRAELQAQVDCFAALAGRLPDHLDCHHWAYLYPPFFAAYVDLAERVGLALRIPFSPQTDLARVARRLPYLEGFPGDVVRGMVASNSALLRSRDVVYPDRFVASFYGQGAVTLDHLLALLDGLPPGATELMCHPGYDGPELAGSTYRAERETELALLCQPAVRARIAARGIELIRFGQMGYPKAPRMWDSVG
jgi:predicted glycoside hydrolase/deacetylase ChbG (UPF0249 family)